MLTLGAIRAVSQVVVFTGFINVLVLTFFSKLASVFLKMRTNQVGFCSMTKVAKFSEGTLSLLIILAGFYFRWIMQKVAFFRLTSLSIMEPNLANPVFSHQSTLVGLWKRGY
jgi:hypothetical protein